MGIVIALLWLGGAVTTQAADFNTTIDVEVDLWSSMINVPNWELWSFNESTGGFDKRKRETALVLWSWVGTGYSMTGDVKRVAGGGQDTTGPEQSPPTGTTLIEHAVLNTDRRLSKSTETTNTSHDLGTMPGLNNSLYLATVAITRDAEPVEVRSVTFEIPVRSQASNLDDMQSKYAGLRSPGMNRSEVHPGFQIRESQSQRYFQLQNLTSPSNQSSADGAYSVNDYSIDMNVGMEVAYKVPMNTTLVRLLHDVGPLGACYINLSPRPSWWDDRNALTPWAMGDKPQNRSNQTMHLLPLDPEVEYELSVGAKYNTSRCNFGGVTSYSFYAHGMGPAEETTKQGAKTGAIVGGVVGGVGGALLLVLALLLLLRCRRHKESDDEDNPDITPFTPQVTRQITNTSSGVTGKTAQDTYETSPEATVTPAVASHETSTGPAAVNLDPPEYPPTDQQSVQYAQDAEDVDPAQRLPTIMPPRYNEAWGQRLARSAPRRMIRRAKQEEQPARPPGALFAVNNP